MHMHRRLSGRFVLTSGRNCPNDGSRVAGCTLVSQRGHAALIGRPRRANRFGRAVMEFGCAQAAWKSGLSGDALLAEAGSTLESGALGDHTPTQAHSQTSSTRCQPHDAQRRP